MAITRNHFKVSPRTQVWNIIIPYLKRSPRLQGVNQWFTWEGDVKRYRDITHDDCPAIRISPDLSGPTEWIDELSHKTAMRFVHELHVAGIKATDFIDFWSAIEGAWFDGTNELMILLEANGNQLRVWQKTITTPPTPIIKEAGGLMQTSVGIVTLYMDITTGE